jgi:hypothetical protein
MGMIDLALYLDTMTDHTTQVPRAAVQGIAFGILLMGLFTSIWLTIASSALSGICHALCLGLLATVVAGFVVYAVRLLRKAKEFPRTKPEDKAEGRRIQIWYGVIFGAEGLLIGAACGILGANGLDKDIVPAIALIVGLHFYPMAAVFRRKFDYLTGTWTSVIAIAAILLEARKMISLPQAFLMVGFGTAIATISYGVFMMAQAEKYKAGGGRR